MPDALFTFEKRLEELKGYKSIHGNVDARSADNSALAIWLSDQKKKAKAKILMNYQIKELIDLGVDMKTAKEKKEDVWKNMYRELVAFHDENKNLNVQRGTHPQLEGWIWNQRKLKLSGKLCPDRLAQLEDIGFEFEVRKTKSGSKSFGSKCLYQNKNGDHWKQMFNVSLRTR
jgi:hypothetical protein